MFCDDNSVGKDIVICRGSIQTSHSLFVHVNFESLDYLKNKLG